jgi:hypothetical protein
MEKYLEMHDLDIFSDFLSAGIKKKDYLCKW